LPADKFANSTDSELLSSADKKAIILNSGDELFSELRDKNFNGVGPTLSRKAKSISTQYEDRSSKSLKELKLFVGKLPQLEATKKALAIRE